MCAFQQLSTLMASRLGVRRLRELTLAKCPFIPQRQSRNECLSELGRVIKVGVYTLLMPDYESMTDAELPSLVQYFELLQIPPQTL